MRRAALAALLLAGCGGEGQRTITGTVAPPLSARSAIAVIHGKDGGTAVFVPVRVHGRPYLFQVDTGSAQTTVDAGAARRLGLARTGRAEKKTTISCQTASRPVRLSRWSLGGVPLPTVTASAAKTELASRTHGKVIGLLGADVFDRFGRLTLDFRSQQLTLGGPAPRGGHHARIRVAHAKGETFVFAAVRIKNRAGGFLVDTGAGSSTIDSRAARRVGLPAVGPSRTVTAVSCPTRVRPVRIRNWSLGRVRLPTTTAASSRSTITDQTKGAVVGLIGADVLAHFGRVSVDFRRQELILGR